MKTEILINTHTDLVYARYYDSVILIFSQFELIVSSFISWDDPHFTWFLVYVIENYCVLFVLLNVHPDIAVGNTCGTYIKQNEHRDLNIPTHIGIQVILFLL